MLYLFNHFNYSSRIIDCELDEAKTKCSIVEERKILYLSKLIIKYLHKLFRFCFQKINLEKYYINAAYANIDLC